MGSIVFNDLKRSVNTSSSKPYVYVDLMLDLQSNRINNDIIGPSNPPRDIAASYDEFAIKNSLINIFNTIPGQRFLVPLFGNDLRYYLFKPVTESVADDIGNSILRSIRLWEPRVTVERVYVLAKPDQHEYEITIYIIIPKLKIKTNLTGVLSRGGFREINS